MADTYDKKNHSNAIEQNAASSVEMHQQLRKSLNEIWDELKSVHDDVDQLKSASSGPTRSGGLGGPGSDGHPLEAAIADGLQARGVPRASAEATARAAGEKIREMAADNDSAVSDGELANAVRSVPVEGTEDLGPYAEAVADAVSNAAFEPGRDLPHDRSKLDEARQLIATAATRGPDGAPAPGLSSPPPSVASSEIMRDVSHLTSLLLGSSPAFAEAMRMQSDAIAYSLAAFNKVGDMQRQDALGLAITARAAATKFDHR